MEESNSKNDASGDRKRHLELKKRLLDALESLRPLSNLDTAELDALIEAAKSEENTTKIYHQLKILNEVFAAELAEEKT